MKKMKTIGLIVALGFAMMACEGIEQDTCTVDADCVEQGDGLICLSGACVPPPAPDGSGDVCENHADCPAPGEICLEGRCGQPDNTPQVCDEALGNTECPDGESCQGGQCIEPERGCGDVACLAGRICLDGVCEPDPNNNGAGGNGGNGGAGGEGGLGGIGGGVDDACTRHPDCPSGQLCIEGQCSDDRVPTGMCDDVADCDPGQRCLNGACFDRDEVDDLQCLDNTECADGDRCDADNVCVPEVECTSNSSCNSPLLECVEDDDGDRFCTELCPQSFDPPSCGALPGLCPAGQIAVCEPGVDPFCWEPEGDILLNEQSVVEACPPDLCQLNELTRQACSHGGNSPMCVRNVSGHPTAPSHCILVGMAQELPSGGQHPDGMGMFGVRGAVCPVGYVPGQGVYMIAEGIQFPRLAQNRVNQIRGLLSFQLESNGTDLQTYRARMASSFRPLDWLPGPVLDLINRALDQFRFAVPFVDARDAFNDRMRNELITSAVLWQSVNSDVDQERLAMAAHVFTRAECQAMNLGWPCVNLDNSGFGKTGAVSYGKVEPSNDGQRPDLGGGLDIEVLANANGMPIPSRAMPGRCFNGDPVAGALTVTERLVTNGGPEVCVCTGDIPPPAGFQQGGPAGPAFVGEMHCSCNRGPDTTVVHGANAVFIAFDWGNTHGYDRGRPNAKSYVGRLKRVRFGKRHSR